jgi:hypothetical protein
MLDEEVVSKSEQYFRRHVVIDGRFLFLKIV